MPANVQQILEAVYRNNEAVVHWEDERTQSIRIPKGLCQECPLFPLLFMLFVAGMVKAGGMWHRSWFQLLGSGNCLPSFLPALFYADDIMLLADNAKNLQRLLDMCWKEARTLSVLFSSVKSACMVMNQERTTQGTKMKLILQGNTVKCMTPHNCMRVALSPATNYTQHYEADLT